MRNTTHWSRKLRSDLANSQAFQNAATADHSAESLAALVADLELGVTGLQFIGPYEPVSAVPWLIAGQADLFQRLANAVVNIDEQTVPATHLVGVLRYYLIHRKGNYLWSKAVALYQTLPSTVRLFDINPSGMITPLNPIGRADRVDLYHRTLIGPAPQHRKPPTTPVADAGEYRVLVRTSDGTRRKVTIRVPMALPTFSAPAFNPMRGPALPEIRVTLADLRAAAEAMDQAVLTHTGRPGSYEARLARIQFQSYSPVLDDFHDDSVLVFDGIRHLVGLPNVGKSTYTDTLIYHLTQLGYRVATVVADVQQAVRLASEFVYLFGVKAAPVLGRDRATHLDKVYPSLMAKTGDAINQGTTHPARQWFDQACPLLSLLEADESWSYGDEPCRDLRQGEDESAHICPFINACPQHQRERDLGEALLWVLTPQSLIQTQVPEYFPERTFFLEAVYRYCHVFLVDEADRVQVQFDESFAPSNVLVDGTENSFINRLDTLLPQLSAVTRRGQAGDTLTAWSGAARSAGNITDRLYQRLQHNSGKLAKWLGKTPFTGRSLLDRVSGEVADLALGLPGRGRRPKHAPSYKQLVTDLAEPMLPFIHHPLDDPMSGELGQLTQRLLLNKDSVLARNAVAAWCVSWLSSTPQTQLLLKKDPIFVAALPDKVDFALLLVALEKELIYLTDNQASVQNALPDADLEENLLRRPSRDYLPVLPEAPVGNLLGFCFTPSGQRAGREQYQLSYFRYVGVGRSLLLRFPTLYATDLWQGPHTLLLSATSWAPGSPAYHVAVQPTYLLIPTGGQTQALDAINRSRFTFLPQTRPDGTPVRISGKRPDSRPDAVRDMAEALTRRNGPAPSPLESIYQSLEDLGLQDPLLWQDRAHLLMIASSYIESDLLYHSLQKRLGEQRSAAPIIRNQAPEDDEAVRLGAIHSIRYRDLDLVTGPLPAIARGHNILNDQEIAYFGAACFVARPMPRPGEWLALVQRLNAKAVSWRSTPSSSLAQSGEAFRRRSIHLLNRTTYSPPAYWLLRPADRYILCWDVLVTMWQVIGRLIRGNVPAQVYFLDAQFFPPDENGVPDRSRHVSLLGGISWAIDGYLTGRKGRRYEQTLAKHLYGPFGLALHAISGV